MPKSYPTKKPYDGYPLTPRSDGRYQKKIRRKLHYFGKDGDHEGALREYLEVRDDLHAGRTPRRKGDVGPTVADLLNGFLQAKQRARDNGELSPKTFFNYHRDAKRIVRCLGKSRSVADLRPEDFSRLRAEYAKTMGPAALTVALQSVRSVFKYGFEVGMYDHPIRFGPEFKSPAKRVLRKQRAKSGVKMFTQTEIHKLLAAAFMPMRAAILLGCNAGFGNSDVAQLPLAAIDFEAGVIDFPRPKTGIPRRCPLWVETADAIREALAHRPIPRSVDDADQVLLTPRGLRWVRHGRQGHIVDTLAMEFGKLKSEAGINGKNRGFYTFRHVFRTIADEVRDGPAIDLIMGHTDNTMGGVYRERIDDSRLRAVVGHVHTWLFGR